MIIRFSFLLLLSLLLFSCQQKNIDIAGKWEWQFTNEHDETHVMKVQLNTINEEEIIGFYCGAFGNGNYVDCAGSDSDYKNIPNLKLKRVSPIKFEGSIRSNRATPNETGLIEITYHQSTDQLFFDIIKEPAGEFYFPDEVEFIRIEN